MSTHKISSLTGLKASSGIWAAAFLELSVMGCYPSQSVAGCGERSDEVIWLELPALYSLLQALSLSFVGL